MDTILEILIIIIWRPKSQIILFFTLMTKIYCYSVKISE